MIKRFSTLYSAEVMICCVLTPQLICAEVHSAAAGPTGTRLAVSEAHDEHGGLMPPVKHQHHQEVPQLVAGTNVVHLACRQRGERFSSFKGRQTGFKQKLKQLMRSTLVSTSSFTVNVLKK